MTLKLVEGFRIVDATKNELQKLEWALVQEKVNVAKQRYRECFRSTVGIKMARNEKTVITLYALIELECPFCFIPERGNAADYGVSWLIREDGILEKVEIDGKCSLKFPGLPTAYRITTSGTTGAPKLIDVPWTAIMPNIIDFCNRLNITGADRVLFMTSLHFDPSIVELFLPAFTGSQLIIASDAVRSSSKSFMTIFNKTRPTIVQLTPAIISIYGQEVLDQLFERESPLRVLLVGGAPFPLTLLKPYIEKAKHIQVYNVYGITEVSCWASLQQIVSSTDQVSIGRPLLATSFVVAPNKELLIGGSRQCYVDGILAGEFTPTGDLVKETDNGLVLMGRIDDEIKINDIRVNLSTWAMAIVEKKLADAAEFLFFDQKFLVLFVVNAASGLEESLTGPLRPAKIFHLQQFMINSNGKVDKKDLRNIIAKDHAEISVKMENRFWEIVAQWNIETTSNLELSFRAYGVDSFAATKLAFEMNCPELFSDILSDSITINEFIRKLHQLYPIQDFHDKNQDKIEKINPEKKTSFRLIWSQDFGKCLDSEPRFIEINGEKCVICASYGGEVIALNVETGNKVWRAHLPKGVDSTIACWKDFVIIGCLDNNVYIYNTAQDVLHWKFATNGPIHVEVVVEQCAEIGYAYVFSNDEMVYKLNVVKRGVTWCCKIGSTGRGKPLLCEYYNQDTKQSVNALVIGTLNQRLICLHRNRGCVEWETKLGGPVFATPIFDDGYFLICTANGIFYRLRAINGVIETQFDMRETIFAACYHIERLNLYIVSTQEGSLWFFKMKGEDFSIMRRIQIEEASFVKSISRASIDYSKNTLSLWQMSTESVLYTIEISWVENTDDIKLYGEKVMAQNICDGAKTFTQPAWTSVLEGKANVFVASRDDLLRCIQLDLLDL